MPMGIGLGMGLTLPSGKGGGVNPPYPAPSGYQWAFVVENDSRAFERADRIIELQRAA